MYRDEIWIAFYDNRGTLSHQVLRWKKRKKKEEKKLVGKRSNPNPSKRSKGCERSFQDTRIIVFHRLGGTPW